MARPALLFDLDGTLIDSIELLLSSVRHAFTGRRGPSDEEWIQGIGTPLISQLRPWASTEEELRGLIDAYRHYQHAHHDRLTRAFEGTVEVMANLHGSGHPTALVTSKANDLARRSLGFVGLDRYIDVVIGFDDTTRHKPEPDPVFAALDRLGAPADTALFVGDSPHDMHAGRRAGVRTAAALWGPFSRDALAVASPDYYLERIGDVVALAATLGFNGRPAAPNASEG